MPKSLSPPADCGNAVEVPSHLVARCGDIAVLIPCWNEEVAISDVVDGFHRALPGAKIYVYDNNSTDKTAERAARAGAVVRSERRQGKGNVIRRMFADIEADIYLLVDGDGTYDASAAPQLAAHLIRHRLDLVNARRVDDDQDAYRRGHRLANRILTRLVRFSFGDGFDDMLSGYKVLSRRLVKSVPLLSSGFEIETELAVQALSLRLPIAEVPTRYRARAEGSRSKLRSYRDGFRILRSIAQLIKEERPLFFFSCLAVLLAVISIALALPVLLTFLESGLVPRLPTAVLAASIMILSFLSLACGLILDTVTRGRREMKRLFYLTAGTPPGGRSKSVPLGEIE